MTVLSSSFCCFAALYRQHDSKIMLSSFCFIALTFLHRCVSLQLVRLLWCLKLTNKLSLYSLSEVNKQPGWMINTIIGLRLVRMISSYMLYKMRTQHHGPCFSDVSHWLSGLLSRCVDMSAMFSMAQGADQPRKIAIKSS